MNTRLLCAVCLIALSSGPIAAPQENPNGKERPPEKIRAEMRKLHAQLENLEKEARLAEKIQEQEECFADIQAESRERAEEYAERMADIHDGDGAETPAGSRRINATLSHINKCRALDLKIQALKDYTQLEQARAIQEQLELIRREWNFVTAPTLDLTARLAQLKMVAEEIGAPELSATHNKISDLARKHLALGKQQFDAWKAAYKSRKELETQIRSYWQAIEQHEEPGE